MSEFLHEGGASGKSKVPKARKRRTAAGDRQAPLPPAARKRTAAARRPGRLDPALDAIMKDFKAGVSRLRGLTDRLVVDKREHRPEFAGDRPGMPTVVTPELVSKQLPPPLSKIIERELKVVSEQVPRIVRIRDKGSVTREYETRVNSVVQQHLPQVYAAILRAEKEVREKQAAAKPASVVLRPGQPGVASLMRAARAIRSGRLPFLDRKTREEARTVLERVWGTKRTTRVIQSNDTETRRLIEQHRLIPLAVRESIVQDAAQRARKAGWRTFPHSSIVQDAAQRARKAGWRTFPHSSIVGPPKEFVRDVEREIVRLLPPPRQDAPKGAAAPVPLAAHDIPRLQQQGVPSFATQGAVAGGSYIGDPGEDVHVITREGNPLTSSGEAPMSNERAAAGMRRPPAAAAGAPDVSPMAPPAARHAPPPVPKTAASQTAGGLGAGTGGGTAGGQGGPMELRGRLEIPGLADWIADVEGRLEGRG